MTQRKERVLKIGELTPEYFIGDDLLKDKYHLHFRTEVAYKLCDQLNGFQRLTPMTFFGMNKKYTLEQFFHGSFKMNPRGFWPVFEQLWGLDGTLAKEYPSFGPGYWLARRLIQLNCKSLSNTEKWEDFVAKHFLHWDTFIENLYGPLISDCVDSAIVGLNGAKIRQTIWKTIVWPSMEQQTLQAIAEYPLGPEPEKPPSVFETETDVLLWKKHNAWQYIFDLKENNQKHGLDTFNEVPGKMTVAIDNLNRILGSKIPNPADEFVLSWKTFVAVTLRVRRNVLKHVGKLFAISVCCLYKEERDRYKKDSPSIYGFQSAEIIEYGDHVFADLLGQEVANKSSVRTDTPNSFLSDEPEMDTFDLRVLKPLPKRKRPATTKPRKPRVPSLKKAKKTVEAAI